MAVALFCRASDFLDALENALEQAKEIACCVALDAQISTLVTGAAAVKSSYEGSELLSQLDKVLSAFDGRPDSASALKELTQCVAFVERVRAADHRCKASIPHVDATALRPFLKANHVEHESAPSLTLFKALLAQVQDECHAMTLDVDQQALFDVAQMRALTVPADVLTLQQYAQSVGLRDLTSTDATGE